MKCNPIPQHATAHHTMPPHHFTIPCHTIHSMPSPSTSQHTMPCHHATIPFCTTPCHTPTYPLCLPCALLPPSSQPCCIPPLLHPSPLPSLSTLPTLLHAASYCTHPLFPPFPHSQPSTNQNKKVWPYTNTSSDEVHPQMHNKEEVSTQLILSGD